MLLGSLVSSVLYCVSIRVSSASCRVLRAAHSFSLIVTVPFLDAGTEVRSWRNEKYSRSMFVLSELPLVCLTVSTETSSSFSVSSVLFSFSPRFDLLPAVFGDLERRLLRSCIMAVVVVLGCSVVMR